MKKPPPIPQTHVSPPPLPAQPPPLPAAEPPSSTRTVSASDQGRDEGSVIAVVSDPTPSTGAVVVDEGTPRESAPKTPQARRAPQPPRSLTGTAIVAMGLAIGTSAAWHRLPGSSHGSTAAARAGGDVVHALAAELPPAAPEIESRSVLPHESAQAIVAARRPAPEAMTGNLRVTVGGDHRVFVDGRVIGEGPGTYPVAFGKHEVQVGSMGAIRALDVPRGGEVVLDSTGWKPESIPEIECAWAPYQGAWGCGLPEGFAQGRFGAPPAFRDDPASVSAREKAWSAAKSAQGARAVGRVGVFVPKDNAWTFVPGTSWSPSDPVFLPKAK